MAYDTKLLKWNPDNEVIKRELTYTAKWFRKKLPKNGNICVWWNLFLKLLKSKDNLFPVERKWMENNSFSRKSKLIRQEKIWLMIERKRKRDIKLSGRVEEKKGLAILMFVKPKAW